MLQYIHKTEQHFVFYFLLNKPPQNLHDDFMKAFILDGFEPNIVKEVNSLSEYFISIKLDEGIGYTGREVVPEEEDLCTDFHPIEAEVRNKLLNDPKGGDSDFVPSREIRIGKNCFIGCNTIILKGTVLGDGCVVGAGAVVSGKFEGNCVIVGNPAKVIKYRFPQEVIDKLLKFDLNIDEFTDTQKKLLELHVTNENVDELIRKLKG